MGFRVVTTKLLTTDEARRTTDDGHSRITKAHPDLCTGELKINPKHSTFYISVPHIIYQNTICVQLQLVSKCDFFSFSFLLGIFLFTLQKHQICFLGEGHFIREYSVLINYLEAGARWGTHSKPGRYWSLNTISCSTQSNSLTKSSGRSIQYCCVPALSDILSSNL